MSSTTRSTQIAFVVLSSHFCDVNMQLTKETIGLSLSGVFYGIRVNVQCYSLQHVSANQLDLVAFSCV